ncbi:MAG: hypothetical protein RLZZ181_1007 [Pseudomonadota bacterium]
MKTVAKDEVELAERLLKVIEARKELEKEEKALKDSVKEIMGDEKMLEARTDLDKKRMVQDLGMDLIRQYETTSSFQMMTVRSK